MNEYQGRLMSAAFLTEGYQEMIVSRKNIAWLVHKKDNR